VLVERFEILYRAGGREISIFTPHNDNPLYGR